MQSRHLARSSAVLAAGPARSAHQIASGGHTAAAAMNAAMSVRSARMSMIQNPNLLPMTTTPQHAIVRVSSDKAQRPAT